MAQVLMALESVDTSTLAVELPTLLGASRISMSDNWLISARRGHKLKAYVYDTYLRRVISFK